MSLSASHVFADELKLAHFSSNCHWTVNMAASVSHGQLWGERYSVSRCAIFVPEDSSIHKPEDLAGVDVHVHVGFQSGSRYTTIQALETLMDSGESKLNFGGNTSDRVDLLLDGAAPAATVFGSQLLYYLSELPERHAKLINVRRFGPGERLIFKPYTEAIYIETQTWNHERGIFDAQTAKRGEYREAVARIA